MARSGLLGVDVVKRRMKILDRNIYDAVSDEMDDIAAHLLSASNDVAPQLTGLMIQTSATDSEDRRREGRLSRSVYYTQPYAIYQHEGNFNPGPVTAGKSGAGRKFLSRPYEQNKQDYIDRVGRAINRTLRQTLR